jgi:hypothetical protein
MNEYDIGILKRFLVINGVDYCVEWRETSIEDKIDILTRVLDILVKEVLSQPVTKKKWK